MKRTKPSDAPDEWEALQQRIISCERCPRLRNYCRELAATKRRAYLEWEYWGRPVPNFGDRNGRLLIVGLAPGAHGSNRTGRMFTGDRSGEFLYRALHENGLANKPTATDRNDGLELFDVAITATAHCAPPDNKPLPNEIANCSEYLVDTFRLMTRLQGVIALGGIGFDSVLRFYRSQEWIPARPRLRFGHGVLHTFPNAPFILCSYHPSQQNTFTGRLTVEMFDRIFREATKMLV